MSKIVAVIGDLIFRSKVEGTGRAVGAAVSCATSAASAQADFNDEAPNLVIVDMALPADEAQDAIRAAKTAGAKRIVAFFSHVETRLAESARECGADDVMPRSQFVTRLPDLLREAG